MLLTILLITFVILCLIGLLVRLIQQQKQIINEQNNQLKKLNNRIDMSYYLWEEISDFIIVHSLSGTILNVNQSFLTQMGYEIEELKDTPMQKIVHPEYFTDWENYIENLSLKETMQGVINLFDSNQKECILEYKSFLVKNDNQSKYIQMIARDITSSVSASRKVNASDKKFKLLFDMLPYGGEILDVEGNIIHCSKNIDRFLGYNSSEIIGRSFTDFIEPRILDDVKIEFELKKLEPQSTELILNHKNGKKLNVLIFSQPFYDEEEKFLGVIAINIDVTRRKKVEKEKITFEKQLRHRQKIEALGTLAGGITHDFNNILAAILGFADLALEDLPENHPIQEYISEIVNAGNYGRDLVRQILSFSHKVEQNYRPVQIKSILKQAVKLIRILLPANIEIQVKLMMDERTVLSDPVQINQVLLNLATNAFHAMRDEGSGVLSIMADVIRYGGNDEKYQSGKEQGEYIQIIMQDSGNGMDDEICSRIFEPFFTTKQMEEGIGLGLSLVKGIIESHQGEIFVESSLNEGTTFTILIPVIEEEIELSGFENQEKIQGRGKILIVDDDEALIRMSKKILDKLGYNVTGVTDPCEALDMVKNQPESYNLVITDQIMPKMMGIELAKCIHEIREDLPIILLSGNIEDSTLKFQKEDFIFAYLDKPVNLTKLSEVVAKAINGKEEKILSE